MPWEPSCRVCSAGPLTVRRIGGRDLDVCSRCGFGVVVAGERPADYWDRAGSHDELNERYWQARLPVFVRALAQESRDRRPGRLVDLGGGTAHFAQAALAEGWDAYSFDVSELAVRAGAARVGAERSLGELPGWLEGTCDVVTLWCVVAHVADPSGLLADARRLLKPGGSLLLSTPNFRFQTFYAAAASRLGRPFDFVAHDHFSHYTPRSIAVLLGRAGFASSPAYWGVTEDCVIERRLATALVPAKRVWNRSAWTLTRAGLPLWTSELHVKAVPRPTGPPPPPP